MKECRAKAEAGDGEAMYRLGSWYEFGSYGLAIDKAQARAWHERSAAARDPRGMGTFGSCLLLGIGGPQDNALGLVNATEAAGLGSNLGAYLFGKAFFNGELGLPKLERGRGDGPRERAYLARLGPSGRDEARCGALVGVAVSRVAERGAATRTPLGK